MSTEKKKILILVENGIIGLDLSNRLNKNGFEVNISKYKNEIIEGTDLLIISETLYNKHMNLKNSKGPVVVLTSQDGNEITYQLKMPFMDEDLLEVINFAFSKENKNIFESE